MLLRRTSGPREVKMKVPLESTLKYKNFYLSNLVIFTLQISAMEFLRYKYIQLLDFCLTVHHQLGKVI